MNHLIEGNLALKSAESTNILLVETEVDSSNTYFDILSFLPTLSTVRSTYNSEDVSNYSHIQEEQNQEVKSTELRNSALKPTLSFPALQKVRELISGNKEERLFVKTLIQVVNKTINLLAEKIYSISIDLADIQNVGNLSWTQIELIICLNTREYSLAETVFFLAENLCGRVLETTGFFFTTTVLAQIEYQPKPSHSPLTVTGISMIGQAETSSQGDSAEIKEGASALPDSLFDDLHTPS